MLDNQVSIERSVLASYLLIDITTDFLKKNARKKLDTQSFIMPLHKRISEKINEAIDKDMPLPLVLVDIQDKISKTKQYQDQMLEIEATMPLSNDCGLDWYIKLLIQNKIEREFTL